MTQPFSNPYQTAGDIYYPLRVILFIGLLSTAYVLSKPATDPGEDKDRLLPDTRSVELPELLPWQRKASEKATQRYAAAQEKMWNRWNDAMFERKE